jgi:tetratricopeptide (TPR) repeat protein
MVEFGMKESKALGGRPARVEVRGAAMQEALATTLAGTGTFVVAVDDLAAVKDVLRNLEAAQNDGDRFPGALEAPGVTVDRLRAFADAAARFFDARPWQHLANEDLVVVESPKAPKGMAQVSVLGNRGQEFGFAFFASRRAFERVLDSTDPRQAHRAYGVTFGPIDELPFADGDAWEDHALPVASSQAYPLAADFRSDGRMSRPDSRALNHMEALLRVLADTTEDELDSGRWQREVTTFDGPITLTLSLPFLLEAEQGDSNHRRMAPRPAFMPGPAERGSAQVARFLEQRAIASIDEINHALAEANDEGLFEQSPEAAAGRDLTPLEQAQELTYDASDATGRLRIKLARKALSVSPDCADACIILGEAASTPEGALDWYQRGVEAGERAIGPTRFAAQVGEFWGHLDTRPYMRVRLALAETLRALGRHEEALAHYRELLRLNPNDNQGVRYLLLPALLERGQDQEAGALLRSYDGDIQAIWPYSRALWLFRQEGDAAAARSALQEATRINPHVVKFLLDPDSIPWTDTTYFSLGSKEEAVYASEGLREAFEATAGALSWLGERASSRTRTRRPKTKRR